MKLEGFPVCPETKGDLLFDGQDPVEYLLLLSGVPGYVDGHENHHVSEHLLDPYVYWQFIAAMCGLYTPPSVPFIGNWRVMYAARRMAEKLGAKQLTRLLMQSEADLRKYTAVQLDNYEKGKTAGSDEEVHNELCEIFDARFARWFESRDSWSDFGEVSWDGHPSISQLADWVSSEMPITHFDSRYAMKEYLERLRTHYMNSVKGYYEAFARRQVGEAKFSMISDAKIRFKRHLSKKKNISTSHEMKIAQNNPLHVSGIISEDEKIYFFLQFSDALSLVDDLTWTEIARIESSFTRTNPKAVPMWSIKDKPQFTIDSEIHAVKPSNFNPFAQKLTYLN